MIILFEEIRWIHVLGGKGLPAASYGILPNLKKKKNGIRDEYRITGTTVNRTYGMLKNLHIYVFLLTVFVPIYYGPP